MTLAIPDRIRITESYWLYLQQNGIDPATVLSQAQLPRIMRHSDTQHLSTHQYFALWKAITTLVSDPTFGVRFGERLELSLLPLSTLAAYHARCYRDSLARIARFNDVCRPMQLLVDERSDECVVELQWLYANQDAPNMLTDSVLTVFVELGRRGTRTIIRPKRIETRQPRPQTTYHQQYFQCPILFNASRNAVVLRSEDLDLPFISYNAELLAVLQAQLEKNIQGYRNQTTLCEQVKWILKQMLTSGRPTITSIAHELGMSVRTLQRRILQEGRTFRDLLIEVRREQALDYLSQAQITLNETASLLGFEDKNSLYRAFRSWEGTTPANWREDNIKD